MHTKFHQDIKGTLEFGFVLGKLYTYFLMKPLDQCRVDIIQGPLIACLDTPQVPVRIFSAWKKLSTMSVPNLAASLCLS
jgi:hypothetical protein